jgi:hypothetical protein
MLSPRYRRRREAESNKREKRQARDDSDEDADGGLTREAAVVSPIRRYASCQLCLALPWTGAQANGHSQAED